MTQSGSKVDVAPSIKMLQKVSNEIQITDANAKVSKQILGKFTPNPPQITTLDINHFDTSMVRKC